MARPLSIIIPHFSKQESLKQVFNELQLQINPDDEILIIDDYSPGGVPDFDCLCTKVIYPPKKLTPHIYRLNTLRNIGLQHASHDPCIILDPDCIPNPHFLDNARKMYDPSVLFGGRIDRVEKEGELETDMRAKGGSRWTSNPVEIYGGCMVFSRDRTRLIGWFDEGFNGAWGTAEHEFASRCHHSGIRLRYSEELLVTHQWHPPISREGYERNRARWIGSRVAHAENLSRITPYKPAVAVLMVTMMRPHYVDQGMRALFRHSVPLRVRLVNNGDQSKEQMEALQPWMGRWAVEYVNHPTRQLLSTIRTDTMKHYSSNGYKYLIMIDDDITPMSGSVTTLISEAEAHPELHAIAGYIMDWGGKTRLIGGRIRNGVHYYYQSVEPRTVEVDYVSSGFTIMRLNKVVPYGDGWEMGWNDWDWSNELKKQGLRVGVTGKAGAYHRYTFTSKGVEHGDDSPEYKKIRYDRDRHNYMAEKFKAKWGYEPKPARPMAEMRR